MLPAIRKQPRSNPTPSRTRPLAFNEDTKKLAFVAANSLMDQGCDVVTCHVDSPKVIIETAEKRGVMTCGYHTNQAALAPKGYLTGAEWCRGTPDIEIALFAEWKRAHGDAKYSSIAF